jgi:hypothetical protein
MAGMVPVMWAVWGALVAIMVALKIYTGRLTKDEADQLVLDSAFDRIRDEQAAMVAKVNKIEPVQKVALWLVVTATVFVLGYYVWDIYNKLR